jgi:predicted metal-binding protein
VLVVGDHDVDLVRTTTLNVDHLALADIKLPWQELPQELSDWFLHGIAPIPTVAERGPGNIQRQSELAFLLLEHSP